MKGKKKMTSKDYLSQEEIDALLRQTNEWFNEPSGGPDVNDYLDPIEQDALGEIGNITFGSAATALSTLLGKKVDITTPKVSVLERTKLDREFPKPHVAIHVKYVDGFDGINLLVIKTKDAQVIADLMMGGAGVVPEGQELTELHISAVQEAMNQMMGSSATSMSTIFNRFVNISPPGINILDLANGEGVDRLPDVDVFVKIAFRLKIGDLIDSTLMQLLTVPFAKEMVATLLGGSEPQPAEPTAAADTQTSAPSASAPQASPAVQNVPEPAPEPDKPQMTDSVHEQSARQAAPNHYGSVPNRGVNVQPVQFESLNSQPMIADETNLSLLLDIPLKVTVELGRTKKLIREILEFSQGTIIELDKLAGEPVDIMVNNKLIAKGEVVVIDENFGVRVTDIISPMDRIQKLQ